MKIFTKLFVSVLMLLVLGSKISYSKEFKINSSMYRTWNEEIGYYAYSNSQDKAIHECVNTALSYYETLTKGAFAKAGPRKSNFYLFFTSEPSELFFHADTAGVILKFLHNPNESTEQYKKRVTVMSEDIVRGASSRIIGYSRDRKDIKGFLYFGSPEYYNTKQQCVSEIYISIFNGLVSLKYRLPINEVSLTSEHTTKYKEAIEYIRKNSKLPDYDETLLKSIFLKK